MLDPGDLAGELAELYAAYRAELDRLGLWDRDLLRRRAAERLQSRSRRLARRAGLRLRLRGPDRAPSGRCSRRSPAAPTCRCRCRTSPDASRSPRSRARPRTSRRSRTGASRSCRRARPSIAHPALAHLERALFEESPPPPPELDAGVRFLEGAGARGTLELVGEELVALIRGGTPPEQIALVAPSLERWRAPLETVLGGLGVPYAIEPRVRLGATPLGHALLQLLRFAWLDGGSARALRVPALAVLRARAVVGRLRRGAAARPRDRTRPPASRRRPSGCARRRCPRSPSCALPSRRSTVSARCFARWCAPPTAPRRRPPARRRARDLRAFDAAGAAARRARGVRGARRRGARGGRRRGARARRGAARVRRTRPAASPSSTCCARARAATTSCSCSASKKARCRARSRTRRSSTTTRAASSAAASSGPTRSAATATSSTRRARARRSGSTSSVRRRPTTAARASRARSGKRSRRSSTRTMSRARRCGGRSRLSPGRSRRRRPTASGCARSRSCRSPTPTARPRRRRGERLGTAARACPLGAAARRRGLTSDVLLAFYGAKTTFGVTELERFADCSSAWLFERVISPRTIDAEVDPMLRGSVAHSALHKFYAGLPKELGHDRVTPENVEQARRLPAALPRRRDARRRSARARPTCRRPSSTRASSATSRASSATRPTRRCSSCRGASRCRSAPTARRPSCSAGCTSATTSS